MDLLIYLFNWKFGNKHRYTQAILKIRQLLLKNASFQMVFEQLLFDHIQLVSAS